MLAHALPGRRRRTRYSRYTLVRRMYGAPFWLRPTAALRNDVPNSYARDGLHDQADLRGIGRLARQPLGLYERSPHVAVVVLQRELARTIARFLLR